MLPFLKRHGAFLILVAVVAPLMVAFTSQPGLASFGDDSVSYLLVAQHMAGTDNPFAAPWVGAHSHFPPLFPLVLALSGAAADFAAAHRLVAAFSILALVGVYRWAALQLGSNARGFWIAFAFALTPTAWIGAKGILSEPLFLLASLAALLFHAQRMEERPVRTVDALVFGTLLAAAVLTRATGNFLVVAYAVHVGFRAVRARRRPDWRELLPAVPVVVLAVLWSILRERGAFNLYEMTAQETARSWLEHPALLLGVAADFFLGAWVATFQAGAEVSTLVRVVCAAFGVLAITGAVLRAARNRVDGWYVLAFLPVLFLWIFSAENSRRLLYPLVPLMLVHVAQALTFLSRRAKDLAGIAWTLAAALPVILAVPAMLLIADKARDREPLIAGIAYSRADITDYYTTIQESEAGMYAGMNIAVLAGLESLQRVTPPDARVMWVRPEYVALLGHRQGVPMLYRWTPDQLAAEVRRSGSQYLVMARLFKTDIESRRGDAFALVADAQRYASPSFNLEGDAFILLKVDPAALEARLRAVP